MQSYPVKSDRLDMINNENYHLVLLQGLQSECPVDRCPICSRVQMDVVSRTDRDERMPCRQSMANRGTLNVIDTALELFRKKFLDFVGVK